VGALTTAQRFPPPHDRDRGHPRIKDASGAAVQPGSRPVLDPDHPLTETAAAGKQSTRRPPPTGAFDRRQNMRPRSLRPESAGSTELTAMLARLTRRSKGNDRARTAGGCRQCGFSR
jgi:hypothetical protein